MLSHPNLKQLNLSSFFSQKANTEIRKDASNMTVDCTDWNLVIDLSRHPLGPPHEGRQHLGRKNDLKEQTNNKFNLIIFLTPTGAHESLCPF